MSRRTVQVLVQLLLLTDLIISCLDKAQPAKTPLKTNIQDIVDERMEEERLNHPMRMEEEPHQSLETKEQEINYKLVVTEPRKSKDFSSNYFGSTSFSKTTLPNGNGDQYGGLFDKRKSEKRRNSSSSNESGRQSFERSRSRSKEKRELHKLRPQENDESPPVTNRQRLSNKSESEIRRENPRGIRSANLIPPESESEKKRTHTKSAKTLSGLKSKFEEVEPSAEAIKKYEYKDHGLLKRT
jgi:hypothetical protein